MEFDDRTRLAMAIGGVATHGPQTPGKQTLSEHPLVQRRQAAEVPGAAHAVVETATSLPAPLPGAPLRPTLQMLFGVQRAGSATAAEPTQVHAAAVRGTATPATTLPYGDRIQRLFGPHDISGIQAHVGPEAAASTREMGARAYAVGDHVVLGQGADLHTVAHEAAHVIQQRGGVQLKGGVGEAGDAYERQADEVADRVVQGESAEELLGPGRSDMTRGHPPVIQMSSEKQDMRGLGGQESEERKNKERRRDKVDQKETKDQKPNRKQKEKEQKNQNEQKEERKKQNKKKYQEENQKEEVEPKKKQKESLLDRFVKAMDAGIAGEPDSGQVYGEAVKTFRPKTGQIVFHGTEKVFGELSKQQIYLSDFLTASSNGGGKFVMLIDITGSLRLIDLSDESTVRKLLLSEQAKAIYGALEKTTGLGRVDDKVQGTFRKGTVGDEDNHLCAWTKEVGYDGFARFPVERRGFPEIAVHATDKLRILGYRTEKGEITEYTRSL